MKGRSSHLYLRILLTFAVSLGAILATSAQSDPDPNSPTPKLLTGVKDNRALTVQTVAKPVLTKSKGRVVETVSYDEVIGPAAAFDRDSRAVLFMADIALDGDGPNAFRVYGRDEKDHIYRFPVISIEPTKLMRKNVYQVTIQLTDEAGFWEEPAAGDIAVYLTWRGLASNEVKFGIEKTGGGVKDSPGVVPVPPDTIDAQALSPKAVTTKQGRVITPNFVGYRWSGDRRRFLEQATYGPTQALDDRIRRIGLRIWLAEQFDLPAPSATVNCTSYPNVADQLAWPCQPLQPASAPAACDGSGADDVPTTCFRDSYTQYQPQNWFFRQAYYGDAQLRQRVTWALSQIWVTSGVDIQQGRHEVEYYKILSNNAFGNYRNLMRDMTLQPAMGDYLNMSQSTKNSPNENYAREVMQLFTIGLFKLRSDGTVMCVEHDPCQAGDTFAPSYDQNNVNNLTKVLTGWSFCQIAPPATTCPNFTQNGINFIDPMILNAGVNLNNNRHDLTLKTLLNYSGAPNVTISPCPTTGPTSCAVTTGVNSTQALANIQTYANTSLDQALDNLYNHPNLAPFVSRRLIQQLVTSDPSPAYVGRIAAVFDLYRASPTQLKEVVKAILLDPEARGDNKTDPHYGKLREPVLFATNILRMFNVKGASGNPLSDGSFALTNNQTSPVIKVVEFSGMAQVPFMSPTVFNFYPPDYVIPGTAVNGPEFALMNTGTAISRASFVNRMIFNTTAIAVNNPDIPLGTTVDLSDLQALSSADSSGGLLMDELNNRMMHGTMSAQMRSTILTAVTAVPASDPLGRARQAVYLVASSSQYQIQR